MNILKELGKDEVVLKNWEKGLSCGPMAETLAHNPRGPGFILVRELHPTCQN